MNKTKLDKASLISKIQQTSDFTNEEKSSLMALLNEDKIYGLVWEDSPEDVEENLRSHIPVLHEVTERALTNGGADAPNHILIEGDNLDALNALCYTHEGKIDVIYIDPPYNTGNKDFVYNDSYVDPEDSYRHSKWLSFMSRRLRIAKRLLSDKGVIFISIDDNEQANLKLLCDEVFEENNFVATFIWRGGKRNMSKWISTSHEYMLLFAKNLAYCSQQEVKWFEKKQGLQEIYAAAKRFVKDSEGDYQRASVLLKEWFKTLPDSSPSKDHEHYCWIDSNGVYFASDISRGGGGGPQWTINNPYTGETVKTPQRGWAYSTIEDLQEDLKKGLIHFNGSGVPCKKRYLKDNETQILDTVFYKDRRGSSKRLRELLGGDLFPFPKDEIILADKLKSFSNSNSIILDFFAGSGTTLHAVMQLNAEDNGKRQCIIVTNNENGICEQVTYERNKRVIQGYTTPKGKKVEGLSNNNLRYYKIDYTNRAHTHENRMALAQAMTELLQIKNGAYEAPELFGHLKVKPHYMRYFRGDKDVLVVYFPEIIPHLVNEIKEMSFNGKLQVYVAIDGNYPFADEFSPVASKVDVVAIPSVYYNVLKHTLPEISSEVAHDDTSSDADAELLNEANINDYQD